MAPRPARLPNPKPTTITPKDSRYERGTTGGQVRPDSSIKWTSYRGSQQRQHAVVRLLEFWVVEHLYVLNDVLPCGFPVWVRATVGAIALDELEEAFRDSIS
jgi:hypothetical protein